MNYQAPKLKIIARYRSKTTNEIWLLYEFVCIKTYAWVPPSVVEPRSRIRTML